MLNYSICELKWAASEQITIPLYTCTKKKVDSFYMYVHNYTFAGLEMCIHSCTKLSPPLPNTHTHTHTHTPNFTTKMKLVILSHLVHLHTETSHNSELKMLGPANHKEKHLLVTLISIAASAIHSCLTTALGILTTALVTNLDYMYNFKASYTS